MKNKTKTVLAGVFGVLLVCVLAVFLFLANIRGEFIEYLDQKYPGHAFAVGFTKVDPIYGKFYTRSTCLDDSTVFSLSKSFNTNSINDNYARAKSQQQYNARLEETFKGSTIEGRIRSITGGGKEPFKNDSKYTRVYIHLSDDAEHISVAKEAMHILEVSNIIAEGIIFTYEKDACVYEIHLSSDDYNLSEKDIQAKVRRIK